MIYEFGDSTLLSAYSQSTGIFVENWGLVDEGKKNGTMNTNPNTNANRRKSCPMVIVLYSLRMAACPLLNNRIS